MIAIIKLLVVTAVMLVFGYVAVVFLLGLSAVVLLEGATWLL